VKKFRPYQFDAFAYTMREDSPALFMDMRMGKTLIAVRRIRLYKPRGDNLRVLVVAPNSALGAWEDELWSEGEESVIRLAGSRKQRAKQLKDGFRWNLLNREGHLALPQVAGVKRCPRCKGKGYRIESPIDRERDWVEGPYNQKSTCGKCRGRKWVKARFPIVQWDAVILDESVFVKNPKAQVTKFFTVNFRDVPHRWILTGLPNPEGSLDYVEQMRFLDGVFCGCNSYYQFRKRYYTALPSHEWWPKKGAEEKISKAIGSRCFVLRRKDAGMEEEKIYQDRILELPDKLRAAYKKAEEEFVLEYDGQLKESTIWRMVQYTWLRRMVGGFVGDEYVWKGKVKELVELLTGELRKDQVVVWFNFNDELLAAYNVLEKASVNVSHLWGEHPVGWREDVRREFQAGKIRVLLLQQRIAESGMNLSAADTAIYFSEPLGLHARQQTEDRILDVDSDRPLLYVHLLVGDSVDIDIRKANKMKERISDASLSRALFEYMQQRRSA